MTFFKFFLSITLTIGLIYASNTTWIIGGKQTPRFGYFLAPSTGFWQNAEAKTPNLSSSLSNDKLAAPVKIMYDDRLVPHIFAENLKDAYFAQGYATASLRLWQMEFQTHVAAGRLSELIGNTTPQVIDMDLQMRRSGLPRAAAQSAELWKKDPEMYAALQSYADGVNAYISSLSPAEYPLEYKLLDYAPEPWTIYKSALLLKFMARDLTSRDEDFHTTNAYKLLGEATYNKLYPEYFPEQSPIIQDSTWAFTLTQPSLKRDTLRPALIGSNDIIYNYNYPQPDKGLGSNNWAVAPSKTAGKKAILCNDPHLRLSLPSIWFEIQIVTPEFNTYGASLPGSPGVISGFNQDVAWGVTNVSHDVRDWYIIKWKDASRQEYLLDSSYQKATHILDTLHIRGGAIRIDTIIYTHWGPVAHSQNGVDIALRWTAHTPSMEPLTFIGLNKAKNYDDYRKAIAHFSCPAQNIVFAANNGDIAITAQGKLPIRKYQQGKFIQDGSSSKNAWSEYIPQEQLPHEYNPAKGFVGSCNQHTTNPTYPYYYFGYFEEHRGRYLNQKLANMTNIKVEDMMRLQNDDYSLRGRDYLPLMLKFLRRGGLTKEELEVLARVEKWNFVYDKNEVAPVIFNRWFDVLTATIFDEIDLVNAQNKLEAENKIYYPEEWTLLNLLKRDSLNPVFDIVATTDSVENIYATVTESFRRTCAKLGNINDIPNWRNTKSTNIMHLARIDPFSYKNVDVGGDGSALNAMTPTNGPSWRMVVELGGKAYGVYPGGQSGNVGSPFYNSMLEKWTKGEYYELHVMKTADDTDSKIIFSQALSK
jgi:penicillin G amidase